MSDLPDPLVAITSTRPNVRVYAVRQLARHLTPENIKILKASLRKEDNSYVKAAIIDALQSSDKSHIEDKNKERDDFEQEALFKEAEHIATRKISRTFSHEIEGIIGRLRLSAKREFENYDGSQSQREIDQLYEFTDVLSKIQTATKTPTNKDYKIIDIIDPSIHGIESTCIKLAGREDMVVKVDKTLFQLAYINGLRNALDAIEEIQVEDGYAIINWDQNDTHYWVTITDNGIGLSDENIDYRKFGLSTKKGDSSHFGSGLFIAKNAMRSMDGDIELKARKEGGAIYKIKWQRDK